MFMNSWFLLLTSRNYMHKHHENILFTMKENFGNDMRTHINDTYTESTFDIILKNYEKYDWLKKLESNKVQHEKIEFIKNEMESAYRTFDIMGGGLYNDWFS